jgi:hypothetical protein
MLDHARLPVGEVGVREFMIGLIAVGIFAGVVLGRSTERARRSYRDQATSKVTFQKYRKTAVVEARKAVFTVLLIGGILVVVFIGLIRSNS